MSTSRRVVSFLFILLWMVPALAFAQEKGRLIGKLVDPEGKPIQGATVTATSPQVPSFRVVKTTDRRGTFILDFRDMGVTYHYRFEKEGFQPLEANQEWDFVGTQRFEWKMVPGSGPEVGALPAASASEPAVLSYNSGVSAVRAKDYATAESKFREAVGHDPKLAQAWAALAAVELQTGNNQGAAESAEKAIALGTRDEAVLTARWQAYRNLNDGAKAAEALKDLEAFGRSAEEAKKFHNEGVGLVKAGNDAAAFAKFQEAVNLDPSLQVSQLGLATAALKIGRNAEAATAAEAVLKAEPGNQAAIRIRYNACLALNDPDRLSEALLGLAAVEPAVAKNGLLKLAFEAYDANQNAKARERFIKVIAVDPNQPLAHYYIALVYVNEGKTVEARTHLERVIAIAPSGKEADTAREMLKQLPK